jgi:hypothetical protein
MVVQYFIWPTLGNGLITNAYSGSMDLEWGGGCAKFTFGTKEFQLPLLRACGGALKTCFIYKYTVDTCEEFIGSTVVAGTCIDDCRHPRSHVKLARMFIEAAG